MPERCEQFFSRGSIMTDNTRRDFLKQAAFGTAAFLAHPTSPVLGANDRVRVGMIGVGNRGQELLRQVISVPNTQLVAIADVYTRRHDEAKKMAPVIQTFDDHRRFLDMRDIDAVIVASPLPSHTRHFLNPLAAATHLSSYKTPTSPIP